MLETVTIRRLTVLGAVLAVTVTACSTETADPATGAPNPSTAAPAATSVPADAQPLLAGYGLDGMDTVGIIDHLDRLDLEERPADLMASVRPGELLISSEDEEVRLGIPDDLFYLSVAPYADRTHDCYYHSLTTCTGELGSEQVQVRVVDYTNDEVLVDEVRTTFDNGFIGFWLPRNIEGTLKVSYDGKVGETPISTDTEAPTCLTTLQLT